MNNKQSPRKTLAAGATNRGRRSFLAKSVGVGIGASLVAYGAEPARAAFDSPCELQASPLDGLLMLNDSLLELQSSVYRQSAREVNTGIDRTIDYFGQLCDRVSALKSALIAERKGAEYERMKAMADIGCVSAGQIKGFSDAGKVQAQLSSLNTISEQIRQMAYELLPEGRGVTLSVEATRILREIILIVDQQTVELRRQLLAAQTKLRRATDEFDGAVQSAQSRISEAIRKIAEPNSANAAAAKVAQAAEELKKLSAQLRTASMQPQAERAELLAALMDGARRWVAGEHTMSAEAGGAGIFRSAVYRGEPAAPIPFVYSGGLYSLLYNFYPPEGSFKAARCAVMLTLIKLSTVGRSPTREEAERMVRDSLATHHITCSEYQGRGCQPDKFIQALANIVLS